jgi:hypothetical protein
MTLGFLPRRSAYELDPMDRLDYVELGFKRNSRDRTTWRSAGICGAPCPISCPSDSYGRAQMIIRAAARSQDYARRQLITKELDGKGNRNRQRRREAPDPGALLDRLFAIEERDFFLALVEEEPEILGEEVRTPPGLVFRPWQRLLRAAHRDPSAAWEVFSREMARYTEIAEKLAAVIKEALEAERNHDSTCAIKLAEKAIPEALEAENAPLAAALEAVRAKGFLTLTNGTGQTISTRLSPATTAHCTSRRTLKRPPARSCTWRSR